jgi:hypothetical protein
MDIVLSLIALIILSPCHDAEEQLVEMEAFQEHSPTDIN